MEFITHPDFRENEPKDIPEANYHRKYGTVTCPHCGHTLAGRVVMEDHFCYSCGGKFGAKLGNWDDEDICGDEGEEE